MTDNDVHDRPTAKQMIDPVCKMLVNPETAAAKVDHGSHVHYFCAISCKEEFEKDPKKYHDKH
ncbi:MAG TPA: YHS domain-containing protein [Thermoanaerobaculia bacterium]|nr:YHS domain-containing protein [Thermoanaerobaculia bacterium]